MKRLLSLLALPVIAGVTLVGCLVALWRYVTEREDRVSEATLRHINGHAAKRKLEADMERRVYSKPGVRSLGSGRSSYMRVVER